MGLQEGSAIAAFIGVYIEVSVHVIYVNEYSSLW